MDTSEAESAGHDTTLLNRNRQDFTGNASVWLFGYGSLLYKVDFPVLECRRATLHGWARRLWQGSHDHRGTFVHPGRVATLIPAPGADCTGLAYRVAPATFTQIDYREKNGYLRSAVPLTFTDGTEVDGVVYIASAGNAAWLGPASIDAIAVQVDRSSGPSGSNRDYVLQLAQALEAMGVDDPHIRAVAARMNVLHDNDPKT